MKVTIPEGAWGQVFDEFSRWFEIRFGDRLTPVQRNDLALNVANLVRKAVEDADARGRKETTEQT